MNSSRRYRSLAQIVVLAMAVWSLMTVCAATQEPDFLAIAKRYDEYFARGEYPEALAEAQAFEAAIRARVGTEHPAYAQALFLQARVYEKQGHYADADVRLRNALAISEKALGKYHIDVAK